MVAGSRNGWWSFGIYAVNNTRLLWFWLIWDLFFKPGLTNPWFIPRAHGTRLVCLCLYLQPGEDAGLLGVGGVTSGAGDAAETFGFTVEGISDSHHTTHLTRRWEKHRVAVLQTLNGPDISFGIRGWKGEDLKNSRANILCQLRDLIFIWAKFFLK